MKMLKELTFAAADVQYEFWTMNESMEDMINLKQWDGESLAVYYKKFCGQVDVTESHCGTLIPAKYGDDEEVRDKLLACRFLAGANEKLYGMVIKDLKNSFLGKLCKYPETVEDALTLLSHYEDES